MDINVDEVKRIAKLAHLQLNEDEIEHFAKQTEQIIKFFDELRSASDNLAKDWRPDVLGDSTRERSDTVIPPLPVEKTVSLAQEKTGSAFQVPKIIE